MMQILFPKRSWNYIPGFIILVCLLVLSGWRAQVGLLAQEPGDEATLTAQMQRFLQDQQGPIASEALTAVPCVGGMADIYPCENVDLLAHIPLATMGGATRGNDSWGWTDPLDGKEYALMGLNNGTAFVDISDPENPIYLGRLPTHTSNSTWRDIKVYANYAFVVSEASGHGMQVFDLTELRSVVSPPVTFSNSAHYSAFGNAHNIAINEDSGYAYAVGTGSAAGCSGGLYMVNIQNPLSPTYAGCFSADGYTHDTQCVIYDGPDVDHQGDEICFSSNTDTLTIADVTNKAAPVQLSRTPYPNSGYTHQGWLTEDHHYFLLGDELDESNFGHPTRTYIWDVSNLEAPVLMDRYDAETEAIDHNLYIKGDYAFQANYRSGLRILDISDVANAELTEIAFFDTYPGSNSANFDGAWSNYPYFDSGVVVISDINRGLFLVRPHLIIHDVALAPDTLSQVADAGESVTYTVNIENTGNISDTYDIAVSGNNWTTIVSTNTIFLEAGESSAFTVVVDISAAAAPGEEDMATITAESQADSSASASVTLTTLVTLRAVDIGAAIDSLIGAPGTTVAYTVDISNTGNVSDVYDLSLSGFAWNSTLSTPTVALDAGQSDTVTVWVEVPVDAQGDDMVTVTAESQADSSASASTTLMTIARLLTVEISAAIDALIGAPGTTVTYTVDITNTGNVSDVYDLDLNGFTWDSDLSLTALALDAGESGAVTVAVDVPVDALAGEMDVVTVTAVGQGGIVSGSVALTTTAGIIYGVVAAAEQAEQSGAPDATLSYTIHITNTGNITDSYDVAVDSLWTAVASSESVTITYGAGGDVQISVTVPADAEVGDSDTITVTVTSQNEAGVSAMVVLTAVATEPPDFSYFIYLPVILTGDE